MDSARPPTPAGVVVAAKVLATCMITRFLKLTSPSAHAHNAAAAPIYVNADTASPSSAHHQFAVRQFGEERGHGADERVGDVDQCDEQHQLDDLVAGEPGDRLGLDLIGPGLSLHFVAGGGHHGAGIGHRLADPRWHRRLGQSPRRHQDRVLAEDIDRRADRGLGAVQLTGRHQKLGDVGLQLFVGGAVFGAAEPAEARGAVVDGDLLAAKVTVGDLAIVQGAQRFPRTGRRRLLPRSPSSGIPDGGVCAYNVQPRSSGAMANIEVFATPRSPIAMAISARCSTARRIEACNGAVSRLRNRSQRQNCRRNPPLR